MPGYPTSITDEQLCQRAAGGDGRAFEELYRRHRDLVRSVVRRHSYDAGRIDDLIQETFAEAWRAVGTFDASRSSVRTWLAMIASRRCIDSIRRASVRPLLDDLALADEPAVADPGDGIALRITLDRALVRLGASQRAILRLVYGEGRSYREVAELLGIPVGTAKSRGRAALDQLAGAIQ
jgi:RNA polymerase sigma factor (sigma-70 family)